MSVRYLTVNEGDLIPLDHIKRVRIVDDDDRASLAKLGPHVKPERFHTRIDSGEGKKSYAPETLDALVAQGVSFVQIDERAFVPSANIVKARNLTPQDRVRFMERTGRELRDVFKAQVETKAGTVLATVSAETVMQRIAEPDVPAAAVPPPSPPSA